MLTKLSIVRISAAAHLCDECSRACALTGHVFHAKTNASDSSTPRLRLSRPSAVAAIPLAASASCRFDNGDWPRQPLLDWRRRISCHQQALFRGWSIQPHGQPPFRDRTVSWLHRRRRSGRPSACVEDRRLCGLPESGVSVRDAINLLLRPRCSSRQRCSVPVRYCPERSWHFLLSADTALSGRRRPAIRRWWARPAQQVADCLSASIGADTKARRHCRIIELETEGAK